MRIVHYQLVSLVALAALAAPLRETSAQTLYLSGAPRDNITGERAPHVDMRGASEQGERLRAPDEAHRDRVSADGLVVRNPNVD